LECFDGKIRVGFFDLIHQAIMVDEGRPVFLKAVRFREMTIENNF
jgi:hypothetical protein